MSSIVLRCVECGKDGLDESEDSKLVCSSCRKEFPRHRHQGIPVILSSKSPLSTEEILRHQVNPKQADLKIAKRHWKTGVLAEMMRDVPRGQLLNFGSGDGGDRYWLEKQGFKVTSFDIYPSSFTDYVCDGHYLPFADAQFDVITSIAVFEHLYNPFQAAQEIYRVLKPNGILIGSCAFLEAYHAFSYFHMSPLGLREVLTRAGFREIEIHPGWSFKESLNARFWLWNQVPLIRRITLAVNRLKFRIGIGLWKIAYRLKGKEPAYDLELTFAGSLPFKAVK